MKTLWIFLACSLISFSALADKAGECTRLWQLEKEAGCPAMPSDFGSQNAETKREHFVINSDFGPSKCVTKDNMDAEKKELKKECDSWIKERKADLGANFLTGTCNPACTPCASNKILSQCTFQGEVHYSVK